MRIWLQTLAVVAAYTAAIVFVDRVWLAGLQQGLALALAFCFVQLIAIFAMLIALLTRRGVSEHRAGRSARVSEAAAAAIAEHAAGMDRLRVLRELRSTSRRDVDRALAAFIASTRGTMQERVRTLARELGARADAVVESAAATTLFDRALLAEETRSRANELAATELPRMLASDDEAQVITALDLIRGWKVVLDVPNYDRVLSHPSDAVRVRAWEALPYVWSAAALPPLSKAVAEPPHSKAAAMTAAAQLRVFDPVLEQFLDDRDHDVAVAAAFALATTAEGRAVLQRRVGEGHRIAFEAIEKATLA